MVENGFNLIPLNSGKPLQELLDCFSVAQILKKRRDRYPGSLKYPYATYLVGDTFNSI